MTRDEALVAIRKASGWRTLCEVHREIYDACKDEKVRELVLEAFILGKKIDAKLREYKENWDLGFYEVNTNRKEDRHSRA